MTDGVSATRQDLVVFDSSGETRAGWKHSFHILVAPYAVANNEEAKGFTAGVLESLPRGVRALVDPQVNKSIQNFRVAGSTKPGSRRVKKITTRYGTADLPRERTTVRAEPGTRILQRLRTEETPEGVVRLVGGGRDEPEPPEPADVRAMLAAAKKAGLLEGHTFHQACGNLLTFRRARPTRCRICNRTHEKDNTLMLGLVPPAEGGDRMVLAEYCRHANPGEHRVVGPVDVAAPPPPPGNTAGGKKAALISKSGSVVTARLARLRDGTVDPHEANRTEFEHLPPSQKNVYSEPKMRDFESTGAAKTLAIKAQCKMGKTTKVRRLIDSLYPPQDEDQLRPPVIRFVTFRQTFSNSVQKEHFPDFELYSDHRGDLDHLRFPRLIVQVESLHRIPMPEAPEPVDMLILDEMESILDQFNSGLHSHFNAAFAMFRWLLRTARRVVVMDANLGDRTLNVLRRMRPRAPPFFHWNRYKRAAGDLYRFTADQSVWLDHLYSRIGGGERVVIPINSLKEAEALVAGIAKRFPEKAVRLYSSKTVQSVKNAHFQNVDVFWSELDVLVYTPTVSAGVSYELEHFDCLFGYFNNMSCDVETCRQMLARVRNIKTREHLICIWGGKNNLPTDVDVLARRVRDKRTNLYRQLSDSGSQLALQFDYDDNGEIRYHESPYFKLWLETVCRANLSKNDFIDADDQAATPAPREGPPGCEGRIRRSRWAQRAESLITATENAAIAGSADLAAEADAISSASTTRRTSRPRNASP